MITINEEQRMYVIPAGDRYSCLGFTYAFDTAVKVAQWCGCEKPRADLKGTLEGYDDYKRVMTAGSVYNSVTHKRCDAELTPQLIGLEGKRVEVKNKWGEVERFYVGKSMGWMPIHLTIKRRDSTGGSAVVGAPFQYVRLTGKSRY